MNTNDVFDRINRVIADNATLNKVKQAWRCDTKEKINKEFNEDVPWELCDTLINIYWDSTVLYHCACDFKKLTNKTKQ